MDVGVPLPFGPVQTDTAGEDQIGAFEQGHFHADQLRWRAEE